MTRTHRTLLLSLLMVVVGVPAIPEPVDGQIGRRILDRARGEAERRVEQRADDAVDRALDRVEDAIVCLATDRECIADAHRGGQEVVLTDAGGNPLPRDEYPADALPAGEGVWLNYDFVPGDRVIFAEDFARDNVGDFPHRLEFMRGNMEVAEWRGERWLRASTAGRFAIILPEELPEKFTLEFEYNSGGSGSHTIFFTDDERNRAAAHFYYSRGGLMRGGSILADGRLEDVQRDRIRTVRVMADGDHVKVYMDETRVANVPNADLGRSDRLLFALSASNQNPVMLRDIRIAAGGRTLYDALAEEGRVVTRGILFDTGSDRIRPESTPVLAEIGEMLREHAELRIRIEGHTDSVGDLAMNQVLSERRAESVRHYLMERFEIDEARLEAAGLGEEQPVDGNDTPEGRQNNRRVELVRL